MGVIQNSINTFLGIAAVGARTSPTLQARTQSHELSAAADAASKGADEQGKAYDELYKQLSKDAKTNKEVNDQLTSEYNKTVKEQEEVRKMYADARTKAVMGKAPKVEDYARKAYEDTYSQWGVPSSPPELKKEEEAVNTTASEIDARRTALNDQKANVRTIKDTLTELENYKNSGQISKNAYSHVVRSAYKNGGNK